MADIILVTSKKFGHLHSTSTVLSDKVFLIRTFYNVKRMNYLGKREWTKNDFGGMLVCKRIYDDIAYSIKKNLKLKVNKNNKKFS